MQPKYLIMYEIQDNDTPQFHISFNTLSKDAKLLELNNDTKVSNIQLFETRKVHMNRRDYV